MARRKARLLSNSPPQGPLGKPGGFFVFPAIVAKAEEKMKNVTMMIRVPESIVPELKTWADEEYLSVNKLATRILAREAKKRQARARKTSKRNEQLQAVQYVTAVR